MREGAQLIELARLVQGESGIFCNRDGRLTGTQRVNLRALRGQRHGLRQEMLFAGRRRNATITPEYLHGSKPGPVGAKPEATASPDGCGRVQKTSLNRFPADTIVHAPAATG